LFLQLAISSPALFAQNVHPASIASSKILSTSISAQNELGGISVSIGFVQNILTAITPEDDTSNAVSPDSTVTSADLTATALRAALNPKLNFSNSDTENQSEISASVSVYPNPFVDRLTLSFDNTLIEVDSDYRYSLLNSRGENIETGPVQAGEKEIAMSTMPSGIYFLVLSQHNQHIETFKLLKN